MDDELEVRDLFAMFAMCGQLANPTLPIKATYNDVANYAYEMADAMIQAREIQDEEGIAAINKRKK